MIKHIVMWKIADGEDKARRAADIKEQLEALKGQLAELADIHVGLNFNTSDSAADVVLESCFATREDLEIYQDNPLHKAVSSNYVLPYVKERRVADYEF